MRVDADVDLHHLSTLLEQCEDDMDEVEASLRALINRGNP